MPLLNVVQKVYLEDIQCGLLFLYVKLHRWSMMPDIIRGLRTSSTWSVLWIVPRLLMPPPPPLPSPPFAHISNLLLYFDIQDFPSEFCHRKKRIIQYAVNLTFKANSISFGGSNLINFLWFWVSFKHPNNELARVPVKYLDLLTVVQKGRRQNTDRFWCW